MTVDRIYDFLSVATPVAILIASMTVFRYTRRKEKVERIARRIERVQSTIAIALTHRDVRERMERIIYGEAFDYNDKEALKRYAIFHRLNILREQFLFAEAGLIRMARVKDYARATLRYFHNEQELLLYLLENRGYEISFAKFVRKHMVYDAPVALPPGEQMAAAN